MEMKFEGYGNKPAPDLGFKEGKLADFNDIQGGGEHVDPFGDVEKKASDTNNMNAAQAFNKKFLFKVDAMGTDMPKKNNAGQKAGDIDGDHMGDGPEETQGGVDAYGDFAGKGESGQSRH
jgi:hypothetical protein